MAENKAYAIVTLAILLILMGILLPIGLADLVDYTGAYNVTSTNTTGTNSTVATLVATVLPVLIVISIILALISEKMKGSD